MFAGYLSGIKLFTGSCALTEPCPYILGYPACVYGFVMFVMMFFVSLRGRLTKKKTRCRRIVGGISLVGVLFSGYLVVDELPYLFSGDTVYSLGLPSCAYGLVFYVLITLLSVVSQVDDKDASMD
jgi:uncharacterized membrane protein